MKYEKVGLWPATNDTLKVLCQKWQVSPPALLDAAVEIAMDREVELAKEAQARTPAKGRRGKLAGKLRKYYVKPGPGSDRKHSGDGGEDEEEKRPSDG